MAWKEEIWRRSKQSLWVSQDYLFYARSPALNCFVQHVPAANHRYHRHMETNLRAASGPCPLTCERGPTPRWGSSRQSSGRCPGPGYHQPAAGRLTWQRSECELLWSSCVQGLAHSKFLFLCFFLFKVQTEWILEWNTATWAWTESTQVNVLSYIQPLGLPAVFSAVIGHECSRPKKHPKPNSPTSQVYNRKILGQFCSSYLVP